MSDPRFRPRDLLLEPAAFGRLENPVWRPSDPSREARVRVRAAQIQHKFAYQLRRKQKPSGTWKAFAAAAGISYDRVSRLLRGEILLRIEDIAAAEEVVGAIFSEPRTGILL